MHSLRVYELRPQKDKCGVDLISDVLPFGRLWHDGPDAVLNAVGYAQHYSRSHHALINVYDGDGSLSRKHEHAGEFKSP